jgi:hypothetical protein
MFSVLAFAVAVTLVVTTNRGPVAEEVQTAPPRQMVLMQPGPPSTTSTTTTTTAAPVPPPPVVKSATKVQPTPAVVEALSPEPTGDEVWDRLAQCESGGNWQANTGNGYYGGLQFLPSTWRSVGGTGLPHQHTREEQINRGKILQQRSGWGQWPQCSRKLGLR